MGHPATPYFDDNGIAIDPVEWILTYRDSKFLHDRMRDQIWRLSNLYYVLDKAGHKILLKPNDAQEQLLDQMWFLNIVLKARQLGFSTMIDLYILDTCLWNNNVKAGIIAHHKDDAEAIFDNKIKYPYDNLHDELKKLVSQRTDRVGEMSCSNGSSIRVSTSFRSGTLQLLHVSEFGKISAKYPDKAIEIKTGAFEAVSAGQMIFVESTAEGREGEFFDMVQRARALDDAKRELDKLDFKFHFFPWWREPTYIADPAKVVMTQEFIKYFDDLELKKIVLTDAQKAWYIQKKTTLGELMYREHPSTPDEAFYASVEGSYYGKIIQRLRQEGRIGKVPHLPEYPVYTFWDLGLDDSTSIWFYQQVGEQRRLFDYLEGTGEGMSYYAGELNRKRGYVYDTFYFPHDISRRELGTGKSLRDTARNMGMSPQVVYPRPKNQQELMDHIEAVRTFLAGCWIDEEHCDQGLKCLENYRKEWDEKAAAYKKTPYHNWASHGADALRTGAVMFKPQMVFAQEDLEPEAVDE